MKKYQLKERALLLLSYAFLQKMFTENKNSVKIYEKTKNDFDIEFLYKMLDNIKKTIANKKIETFLLKRISNDSLNDIDLMTIVLTIMFYHKTIVDKKDFTFNFDFYELLKNASMDFDKKIFNNSIETASNLFIDIFPEKKPLILFKKVTNKKPFNLKGGINE